MTGALTSPSGGVLLLHGGEECCSMRVAPAIKLSPEQRKERPGDPEKVDEAVKKAFEGGGAGIVVSREYEEMRVPNFAGGG